MRRTAVDLAVLALAFGAATAVAELAGARNLGTAMSFGAIAFTLALAALMLRR